MSIAGQTGLRTRIWLLFSGTFVYDWYHRVGEMRELRSWEKAGAQGPPPHLVKQQVVSAYASAFALDTLVETGTHLGDMVYAMRRRFRRIVSIELSEPFFALAQRRFRGYPNIELLCGDSAILLPDLLAKISTPCLFWLDGHYSGGTSAKGSTVTPIRDEVETILRHPVKGHVILIDDARCFNGTRDYPTLEQLRDQVADVQETLAFTVRHDIIRVHSPRALDIGV